MGACRIRVPAHPFVTRTQTFRDTDCSVIIHTEVHFLAVRAPIQCGIRSSIGMQEHTVLDLAPFGIYLNTTNWHCAPCIFHRTSFIQEPALKDISFFAVGKSGNIVCIFVSNCSTLSYFRTLMKELRGFVLNQVIITVNIITVKVTDFILLTIVNLVDMIQCWIISRCPIILVIPIFTSPIYKIKTTVFRCVLVCNCRVTGTNFQNRFLIISFPIPSMGNIIGIIHSVNRLKPNVISPIIVAIWETDDHIVTIGIVGGAKDIIIEDRNQTFDRTGTLISGIRFQFSTHHHDKADRLAIIRSCDLAVRRPF